MSVIDCVYYCEEELYLDGDFEDEDPDYKEFECYFDCDCDACGYYIDNNDRCPFK